MLTFRLNLSITVFNGLAFVIWISARMFIDKSYVTVLFLIYRIIRFTQAEASQVQ